MYKYLSILFVIFAFNVNAQSDNFELKDFNSLKVLGDVEVELFQSDINKAEVTMIKGDLESLEFVLDDDGALKIAFVSTKSNFNQKKAKVKLYYKELNTIKAMNGCKIKTKNQLVSEDLNLLCVSGAYLEVDMKVNNLDAKTSAGSNVVLRGDAHNQIANAVAGSSYDASGLFSNVVEAKALSGSNMKLWATESIKARSNSGANITYKGNPKKEEISSPIKNSIKKI